MGSSHDRRLPLDYLRTVVAVYRTGSFSAASRRLRISQPTVTNHVRLVEEHFGQPLFVRTAAGVSPTPTGHEIVVQTVHHIDSVERVIRGSGAGDPSGRPVTLGGPPEYVALHVLPALSRIRVGLPRIDVALGESADLMSRLEAGELDLVITTVRPRGADITSWPLADEEFWLVGAPEFGLAGAPFSRIDAAPLIAYNRELAIIRRYWNTVFESEPRFDPVVTIPDLTSIRAAAVAGLGITVLPSYLVVDDVNAGRLVRIDEVAEPPINTIFLAASSALLAARPRVAMLAQMLANEVKSSWEAE
ncbi:LysR family transcriptional regulator [Gordonia malaquae]|uniref:LysR family transcriptional regulator n=1 Tax=Gordonia malaquae TaxID=410332 RepID=UPI0030C7938E